MKLLKAGYDYTESLKILTEAIVKPRRPNHKHAKGIQYRIEHVIGRVVASTPMV